MGTAKHQLNLRSSTAILDTADGRSDGQSLTRCMSVHCGEAQAGGAMAGAEDAPLSYAYTYVLFYTDARIHAYAYTYAYIDVKNVD